MRLMRIARCLPMLLLLAPAAAQAKPKWKTVYSSADLKVTMDTASVAANADGSYSVWTQWDYAKARILENKRSYTRLVEKAQLKCSPIVMKRVNTSLYDRAGVVVKAPEELGSSEVMVMSWDPPKRGSDGEKVWTAVCKTIKARPKKK
jgi:hypothetical protein